MKKILIIALILATPILFGRERIYDKNGKHVGYYDATGTFYDQFGNKVTGSSPAQERYFQELLTDRELQKVQKIKDDIFNDSKKRDENFDETMEFIFGKRSSSYQPSNQPTYRYTPPVIPKCGCCQTILESTNKTNFCQPYCECKIDREKSANRLALGFLGVGLVCVLLVIL